MKNETTSETTDAKPRGRGRPPGRNGRTRAVYMSDEAFELWQRCAAAIDDKNKSEVLEAAIVEYAKKRGVKI